MRQTSKFSRIPIDERERTTKRSRVKAMRRVPYGLRADGWNAVRSERSTTFYARLGGINQETLILVDEYRDRDEYEDAVNQMILAFEESGLPMVPVTALFGFKPRKAKSAGDDPCPDRPKPATLSDKIRVALHEGFQPAT